MKEKKHLADENIMFLCKAKQRKSQIALLNYTIEKLTADSKYQRTMKTNRNVLALVLAFALCASLASASWPSFTKICSKKYRTYSPEWNECVISGVEGEVEDRKKEGTFDMAFDEMEDAAEEDNNFKCNTPLPTSLTRDMFAYESIKERPFCGRLVFMDKTDQLLKEGPRNCPSQQTSCKRGDKLVNLKVGRMNIKGSIYYNCFTNTCLPEWWSEPQRRRRRLRRRYFP